MGAAELYLSSPIHPTARRPINELDNRRLSATRIENWMKRRRRANWPFLWSIFVACACVALYVAVQTAIGGLNLAGHSHRHDWKLSFVASLMDATIAVWFFAVGASIGSFLNVVAYRLPIGRGIGGHSGCPFCNSPIKGSDNVPVFAWIRLRGRCRNCRLPISIQYPLVELAVGILFFVIYLTEFRISGANLPKENLLNVAYGGGRLLGSYITPQFVVRLGTYLFAISALFAAGLIAVKRKPVPLKLFAWSIVPLVVAALAMPESIIVRWRAALPAGAVEARLDAFTTILCGLVAGIALARVAAPMLYAGFDRTFVSSDSSTTGARQFVGALGAAGAIVGWQSVVPLAWVTLLSATVAVILLKSFRRAVRLWDLTAWVWLGLVLFRANWQWLAGFSVFESGTLKVLNYLVPALLFAIAAKGFATWFVTDEPVESRIKRDDEGRPRAIKPVYVSDEDSYNGFGFRAAGAGLGYSGPQSAKPPSGSDGAFALRQFRARRQTRKSSQRASTRRSRPCGS